ncbi:MAG: ABC transporter permease [Acidimicrobiales bacterium]
MAVLPSEETPALAAAAPMRAVDFVGAPPKRRRSWVRSLDVYIPGVFLLALLFVCFVWPYVYSIPSPVGGGILTGSLPFGAPGHIFGTTVVGNDIMSRLIYGGRVSFEVMFAVQGIGLVVGGLLGVTAAMLRGVAEAIVMRVLDVVIAFPAFVLVVVIVLGLGASELTIIWALAVVGVPIFARIARAGAVTVREQTFVLAAELAGTKRWRIGLRHVMPNIITSLLTFAVIGAGVVIILAATVSYFGFGIPPPGPSWGNMIAVGAQTMSTRPSLLLIPSIILLVTVIALNTLGEGMRRRWGAVR